MTATAALEGCCPTPATSAATLSVTQLARCVGVKPDTVRYYEKAGLLPPPPRTRADHRRYDDTAVDRLRFIQGAQRLGLRLREIKTLLEVPDTGVCPCGPVEVLLHEHVEELDRELTRLTALRAELARMLDVLPIDCPEPLPGTWLSREEASDDQRHRVLPVLRLRQLLRQLLRHRLLLIAPRPPA